MGKRSYREWEGSPRYMKKWWHHGHKKRSLQSEQQASSTEIVLFWLCVLLGFVWVFVCPHL